MSQFCDYKDCLADFPHGHGPIVSGPRQHNFKAFQAEQQRINAKREQAIKAQLMRDRGLDVAHKRLLWIGGICVFLAVLGIYWLVGQTTGALHP